MLRAAAKNFDSVAVVTDPERYALRARRAATRRRRAVARDPPRAGRRGLRAHRRLRRGDRRLVHGAPSRFPDRLVLELVKRADLAYGENPHQRAAFYVERGARRHLLSMVEQLRRPRAVVQQPADLNAAADRRASFQVPACVIVKHATPCGVAVGATVDEAYQRALDCDPVVGLRRRDRRQPAGGRRPGSAASPSRCRRAVRPRLRGRGAAGSPRKAEPADPRATASGARPTRASATCERVLGGLLVQDRDTELDDRDNDAGGDDQPRADEKQWGDLLFAWRVASTCARTRSCWPATWPRWASAPAR